MLSPNDQFLFTSDFSTGVNSFQAATSGTLSAVAGAPFSAGLSSSAGLFVNGPGTLFFFSFFYLNHFSVLQGAADGTLSLSARAPVLTGASSALLSPRA